MKKLSVFMIVAFLTMVISCGKKEAKPSPLAEILPEKTDFLLKFTSLTELYKYFSVNETSTFGEPIDNLDSLKNRFGFNPYSLKDLESNGFDTKSALAVAVTDFQWQSEVADLNLNGLVLIPVSNGDKAIEAIKKIVLKSNGAESEFLVANEGKFVTISKKDQPQKIYLHHQKGYLYAAVSFKDQAASYLEKVLAGQLGQLSKSKSYLDVIAKVSDQETFFSYVNIGNIINKNYQAINDLAQKGLMDAGAEIKSFDYLKDYEGAGVAIDFAKTDFVVNAVANLVKDSKSLNVMRQGSFDKSKILGIKEHPLLLLSFGMNFSEYYKTIMGMISEGNNDAENYLTMIKTNFGIDIEKDLVDNLGGSINFGIFDGATINMMNYNTLFTANVKDEKKAKEVIEKFISKLPADQKSLIRKEKDYYVYTVGGFFQLYLGVKDKNIIASIGQQMFEKGLSADKKSGFLTTVKDKDLAKELEGNSNVLYINVQETFNAYNNLSGILSQFGQTVDPKMQNIFTKFEYFLFSGKIEENSLIGKYVVKTKFEEPFLISLVKMVKELSVDDSVHND